MPALPGDLTGAPAGGPGGGNGPGATLEELAVGLADAVREAGPHRALRPRERALVAGLVEELLPTGAPVGAGGAGTGGAGTAGTGTGAGAPGPCARALGLDAPAVPGWTVVASDPASVRSWMLLALRAGSVPDVVVQVPHPRSDLDTERLGAALARRDPGAALLQAAAHRRASATPSGEARCSADVAHCAECLFARVADGLVRSRGVAQLQVHGFVDRRAPVDVVLSAGAAREGPLLAAVAAALDGAGERVRPGADPAWADLAGRRNLQGRSAARHGTEFVHLELSRSLRRDPGRRAGVVDALAAALARWRAGAGGHAPDDSDPGGP